MARTRAVSVWMALLSAALALGACAPSRSIEYSLEMVPDTVGLALDLSNFRGEVEVRAGATRQEILVEGDVELTQDLDDEQAQAALDGVAMSATIEEQGNRAVLRVQTTTSREADDHAVSVRISLPRCDGVRITNQGGDVVVVNTSGATTITNRAGAIELRTSRAMTDPVTLTNVDGSIYYQVPKTSTGQFDLRTLQGEVAFVDRVAGTGQSYSTQQSYQGRLGDAGNRVLAVTNRGDVRVWIDEDPMKLTRIFRRAVPDVQDTLFLQGSRRFSRNLPDDHPETQTRVRTGTVYGN